MGNQFTCDCSKDNRTPINSCIQHSQKRKTSLDTDIQNTQIENEVHTKKLDNVIQLFNSKTSHLLKCEMEQFNFLKLISKSDSGNIYLAQHKISNQLFAIKSIQKQIFQNQLNNIDEHINMINQFNPFLVSLQFVLQDSEFIFLGMEYIQGGQLFLQLKLNNLYGESQAKFYFAQLTLALQCLHSKFLILSRDLKPLNILIDSNGYIKLSDFGFNQLQREFGRSFHGTFEYYAPEILQSQIHSKQSDLWTFGCFLYEAISGISPFYHKMKNIQFQLIMQAQYELNSSFSNESQDLLKKLLQVNPELRIGWEQIITHDFFKNIDFSLLKEFGLQPPFIPPPSEKGSMTMIGFEEGKSELMSPDSNEKLFSDFDSLHDSNISQILTQNEKNKSFPNLPKNPIE